MKRFTLWLTLGLLVLLGAARITWKEDLRFHDQWKSTLKATLPALIYNGDWVQARVLLMLHPEWESSVLSSDGKTILSNQVRWVSDLSDSHSVVLLHDSRTVGTLVVRPPTLRQLPWGLLGACFAVWGLLGFWLIFKSMPQTTPQISSVPSYNEPSLNDWVERLHQSLSPFEGSGCLVFQVRSLQHPNRLLEPLSLGEALRSLDHAILALLRCAPAAAAPLSLTVRELDHSLSLTLQGPVDSSSQAARAEVLQFLKNNAPGHWESHVWTSPQETLLQTWTWILPLKSLSPQLTGLTTRSATGLNDANLSSSSS